MSRKNEDKLSIGQRLREERERLGLSRAEAAKKLEMTPQAIGEFERGISYPGGEAVLGYSLLGADVQYILTGVRSKNLDQVAHEKGRYQPTQGVGALARDEQVLVEKYRQLNPSDRTQAQKVFDALVAALKPKRKTGGD